jgi:hypothetical protein
MILHVVREFARKAGIVSLRRMIPSNLRMAFAMRPAVNSTKFNFCSGHVSVQTPNAIWAANRESGMPLVTGSGLSQSA